MQPKTAPTSCGRGRSRLAALPEMPVVVPRRNDTGDDADLLAQLAQGRWDSIEEFLKLRFEAIDLFKSKRYRRLAVAVYEQLVGPEVLDQDDLRAIYQKEQEHAHA